MARIDESFTFKPLRIATLTVSDTRDKATDKSLAFGAGKKFVAQVGKRKFARVIVT